MLIEGHPLANYNGVYTLDSMMSGGYPWRYFDGWPVLENAKGTVLSRFSLDEEWRLHRPDPSTDEDGCGTYIEDKAGQLPVGTSRWQHFDGTRVTAVWLRVQLLGRLWCALGLSAPCP